jgi:N-acetylmuramic acid 6-phosphate etherase
VQALIAGGPSALLHAVEGAEDSPENGNRDLMARSFSGRHLFIGLSASGLTPYVMGAVRFANETGAVTVAVTCHPGSPLGRLAQHTLKADVGPEVLAGSTRLKASTAQKMILNMLSTATMVRLGRTFKGRMIDVCPTNAKLRARTLRMVAELTGVSEEEAGRALASCNGEAKTAVLVLLRRLTQTGRAAFWRKQAAVSTTPLGCSAARRRTRHDLLKCTFLQARKTMQKKHKESAICSTDSSLLRFRPFHALCSPRIVLPVCPAYFSLSTVC